MSGTRQAEQPYFHEEAVSAFLRALQEATRATPLGEAEVYVPPPGGDAVTAKYHHLVYGPRGSGKSTLLRTLQRDRLAAGDVVAWVDQEILSGLSFPDVLVSCVESVMASAATSVSLKIESLKPSKAWFKRRAAPNAGDELLAALELAASNLNALKHSPDDRKFEWTHSSSASDASHRVGKIKILAKNAGASASRGSSKEQAESDQVVEVIESSKAEYLERALPEFRSVLVSAADYCGGGCVFLDDVYLLEGEDQPRVLGYMHRLVKDTSLWLKIGTIRYLTTTYRGGRPPQGIQENHDAHVIALDAGFRQLNSSQEFLEKILRGLADKVDVDLDRLYNPNALGRITLASGCVPRDYLRLASQAIQEARNRLDSTKSGMDRVNVEDVNKAAGEIAPSKFEDLAKDAPAKEADLRRLVDELTEFCRINKAAYFLTDAADSDLANNMEALQHLRFAYLVFQSETLPDKQSQRLNVWLLDVAQLSVTRATQGMDFDGWQDRERRRRRKLVYSPGVEATAPRKSPRKSSSELDGQDSLFD